MDLTLDHPAQNLALDEALLDQAEATGDLEGVLRLWEPVRPMVVLGRSSRLEQEVQLEQCRELEIPVLRRSSGGAAIVAGPGCLMYGVVLSYAVAPQLRQLDQAHAFVLGKLADALAVAVPNLQQQGTSDLALGEFKVSGNSLRCKRTHFLYHGTLLYDFPTELLSSCLRAPPRQPDYRQGRDHVAFTTNLPLQRDELRELLITAWSAAEAMRTWPRERVERLVAQRYGRDQWNLKFP